MAGGNAVSLANGITAEPWNKKGAETPVFRNLRCTFDSLQSSALVSRTLRASFHQVAKYAHG